MEWIKALDSIVLGDFQFDRIDQRKKKLDEKRPFSQSTLQRIKEDFFVEWTYNSNSIEGNTLSLIETKLVLLDGLTVRGKSMREHFETVNHKNAIDFVETIAGLNYLFTEGDILKVHEIVLQNIEKDYAGRYRDVRVRITGANFSPPNPLKVADMMTELINFTNNSLSKIHPILLATLFHHRFVWIHPFIDGNGRTVRLLFNLILMKFGYPPAIILKTDRKKYYDALNQANRGDLSKLLLLVSQAVERSINIYLSTLDIDRDDYSDLSNIASEPDVPYGQEYISLLARQGKIAAHKEGRKWVATKSDIEEYRRNRLRKR